MLITHGCDLQNCLSRAEVGGSSAEVPTEAGQGDSAAARMNLRGSRGAGLQERGRQTHCSNTQTAPDLAGSPFCSELCADLTLSSGRTSALQQQVHK